MRINSTVTTKTGRWSGIKKHVSRKYENDSNKSINKKLTHYNRKGCELNVRKVLKDQYEPYLKKRNAKNVKQGNPQRVKTLAEYLKGKKPTNLIIATFGSIKDKRTQIKLIELAYPNLGPKHAKDRYFRAVSWGLRKDAKSWNSRNPDLPLAHWETNVDEAGAGHYHGEVVPLGRTKRGKPSNSFSNAVKRQYGTDDRRKAMKLWNKQETSQVVKSVGSVLAERFPKVPQFQKWSLHHTGRKHSLSMETYKATHEHFKRLHEQLVEDQRSFSRRRAYERSFERIAFKRRLRIVKDKKREAIKRERQANKDKREAQSKINEAKVEEVKHSKLIKTNRKLRNSNQALYSDSQSLTKTNSALKKSIKELMGVYKYAKTKINGVLKRGEDYFKRFKHRIQKSAKQPEITVSGAFQQAINNQKSSTVAPRVHHSVNDTLVKQQRQYRQNAYNDRERQHDNEHHL